jgi:hypothetical protein
MLSLGSLAFAAPWLLVALAALPVLWWLLRVTPPTPRRVAFRRCASCTTCRVRGNALAHALVAAAAPHPGRGFGDPRPGAPGVGPGAGVGGEGPLLLVVDDGWAAAADWPARTAAATAALDRAGREGRTAALLATAPSETGEAPRVLGPMPAGDLRTRLAALRPKPWAPDHAAALEALQAWRAANPGALASLAVSDGVEHTAQGAAAGALQAALAAAGPLTLARSERPVRLLPPPVAEADRLRLRVQQVPQPAASEAVVLARTGDGRALGRAAVPLPENAASAEAVLELPVELRNQVVRLELEGAPGAGGVLLLDERFRRRPVGLLPGAEESADTPLIGDLFYLDRALAPYAEMRRGSLDRCCRGPIAVLALADRPVPEGPERDALTKWIEGGGTLIRFAGPRLAERPDPLLPVPLRAERQLGGSLSWEQPQRLAPFPANSPFAGLPVPEEVTVERQVLAEPSPRLTERSWARSRTARRWSRRRRGAGGGSCCSTSPPRRNGPTCRCRACSCRCCGGSCASPPASRARKAKRRCRRSRPWTASAASARRRPRPPPWPARPSNRPCRRRATRRAGTARRAAAATRPAPRTAGRSTSAAPCRRPAPPRRRPPAPSCSPSAACRASATSGRGCWRRRCCCWRRTC